MQMHPRDPPAPDKPRIDRFEVMRIGCLNRQKQLLSEQEEEAREFSLSKHSGAFRSGSIFQCFPGATSTELMTSIGKPTPHLAVFDPGIPIYNWRGNERGIMQLLLLPRQFSLLHVLSIPAHPAAASWPKKAHSCPERREVESTAKSACHSDTPAAR